MDQRDRERELITIRGVVAPSEWGINEEVTAVTVYAHDETEYVVNARYMVKKLMKHMDEEIEGTGFVSEDEYGSEVFIMSDFTVLDDEADTEEAVVDDDIEAWDGDGDGDGDADEDEDEEGWETGDEEEEEDEEDEERIAKGTWKRYQYR